MNHVESSVESASLYGYMLWSHRYLDEQYGRLLDALAVDAPGVRNLWTELERGLLAHMEAEERFVLPAFARFDQEEARALLREHGQIREYLLEFGVEIDLHVIRFKRSGEFIEALRSHARREEQLLYQWADKKLDGGLARSAMEHASSR
jgi:hemerythrin-like domain-containing protein